MSCQPPAAANAEFDDAAIVAIGSNLPGRRGSPEQMVRRALAELRRLSTSKPLCSSLYLTMPRDCAPGAPEFVNAAAALWPAPEMSPIILLRHLLRIEVEFGRQRAAARNAPRTLDLDLILWGARTMHTSELQLPHPRFAKREFVLAPLAELAPNWVPPGQSRTVAELLENLPDKEHARIIQSGRDRD